MSTRLSLTGLSPSLAGFPKTVLLNLLNQFRGPNPSMHAHWFGLFRFRSPLLTESHVVFSSSGYLDVSVHRVPFHTLWIGVWMTGVFPAGFPHSEIYGSRDICSSPWLFAAYHVFLRLLVPRHPPCALIRLTSLIYSVISVFLCVFTLYDLSYSVCLFLGCLDISISEYFAAQMTLYCRGKPAFRRHGKVRCIAESR